MQSIIKYFGADHVSYILVADTASRLSIAKDVAWAAGNRVAYYFYVKLGELIAG